MTACPKCGAGHDWEYLLTALGIVHRDRVIGLWTHYLGVLVMLASIVFAASMLLKDHKLKTPGP